MRARAIVRGIDSIGRARYRAIQEKRGVRLRWWKWAILVIVFLSAIGYGVLSHFMGGPRDVYGFLRYALPQWHRGDLRVGEPAPNVRLMNLDGQTTFYLRDRIGQRPLVLVFGSYT